MSPKDRRAPVTGGVSDTFEGHGQQFKELLRIGSCDQVHLFQRKKSYQSMYTCLYFPPRAMELRSGAARLQKPAISGGCPTLDLFSGTGASCAEIARTAGPHA